ncbi:MAG TPA: FtsX-like permease family protein, partial [Candidatus Limnocylindria bacterium]
MGPLRIVLQRSVADWLIVVATWLVIVCATALVAIGVLYGDAVALTGLRRILADQPPTATSVVVEMRAADDELEAVAATVETQVDRILRWTGGELITIEQSESYALPEQASDDTTDLVVFGSYAAIENHAQLLEGTWPGGGAQDIETAVSRAAADALGLTLGDTTALESQRGNRSVRAEIVGIWQPADPTDPYWNADPLELAGVTESASFRTHGPFVVAREDLLGRTVSGDVAVEYRALPDFDRLAIDDADRVRGDTAALERRLGDALGDETFFQVSTELDEILGTAGRSLLVSRSGVVVLTIQFAVLAGYALLLVAGLLVDQRRVETALLRSRGAGVGHVVLFSFLEALVLVVPAVLLAPWLAVGVLGLLNVAGPLADAGIRIEPRVDPTVLLAAGLAGAAAVLGLVLPALGAGRGLAAVRQTISRQGNRTIAQRLGLDLALVILAGVGLWQLRTYGAPLTQSVRGSVGLDPLLVAAPAIG